MQVAVAVGGGVFVTVRVDDRVGGGVSVVERVAVGGGVTDAETDAVKVDDALALDSDTRTVAVAVVLALAEGERVMTRLRLVVMRVDQVGVNVVVCVVDPEMVTVGDGVTVRDLIL